MRVIAYLRVSSIQQVQNGKDGISAQRYACEEFAKKSDFVIDMFFEDVGLSGALPIHRRLGLVNALNELKKGDVLLVYKTDRLARTKKILYAIKEEIEKKKCKFLSCLGEGTESKGKYDFTARMGEETAEFALSMERLLAEIRTKNKMDEKKSRNECVGHIPYGMKLAEDGVHLELCSQEQAIISVMRELKESGTPIRKAACILNERNLLNRGNRPWNHGSFFRIMKRNRAVRIQNG